MFKMMTKNKPNMNLIMACQEICKKYKAIKNNKVTI